MLDLIVENPIRFVIALLIGVATAWWIWGRLGEIVSDTVDSAADTVGDVATGTVDAAKGAGSAVAGGVGAAGAGAAAMASDAKDAVADTASGAKTKVQDVAGKPKIAMAVGDPDDLTKIKGVGPKLDELCQSFGVRRFDQIAAWSSADVAEVDQYLKIKGRIDRDNWVDQAKLLAKGDFDAHQAKYAPK